MTKPPIVTALLSYGMSGEVFHAPLIEAHAAFDLRTIVQRKKNTATSRYPRAHVVDSIDKVLDDKTVELVVINTPNETHFDYTSRALESGKHVVVEKPFTVTAQEASALIDLAREKERVLTVFQNRRWDGDFLTVKQIVETKILGRIVEFEVHYDRFRNYIEQGTWKEEQGPGSGILYNLGSHMLDQVMDLFGMPEEVDARVGIQRTNGKVEDFYDIRLRYPHHHAIVKSSYLVREQGPRYSIHGTEGSFIKYGIDPQEQALKDQKKPGTPGWGVEDKQFWGKLNTTLNGLHVEGSIETIPGNYLQFYQNVFEAIREGKPLAVQPEQSMRGIQLIEACYESNRLKKAIKL